MEPDDEPVDFDALPVSGSAPSFPRSHGLRLGAPNRAPLPPGGVLARLVSDLHRVVATCGPLLRGAALPATVALIAFAPLVLVSLIAVYVPCCVFLGFWSLPSAMLHIGPYTAFGRAAAGETPVLVGSTLRVALRRAWITFLLFAPQSTLVVVFFCLFWAVIGVTFISPGMSLSDPAGDLAVRIVALLVLSLFAIFWIRYVLRRLFLAPFVAIAEGPMSFGAALTRSRYLAEGRTWLLAILYFSPYGVVAATIPWFTGLAQFDRNYMYSNVVQFIAPVAGFFGAAWVGGLLGGAAYAVVTGRAPRSGEDDV
jgi:hypothetical protein